MLAFETANPFGVREDGCHSNVRRHSQKLAEVGKTVCCLFREDKKRVDAPYRRAGYIHAVTAQLILTLSLTVLRVRLISVYTEFDSLGVNH